MPALSAADATTVETFLQIMELSRNVLPLDAGDLSHATPSPDVRTWDDYYPARAHLRGGENMRDLFAALW
jgi:hypothetical protein